MMSSALTTFRRANIVQVAQLVCQFAISTACCPVKEKPAERFRRRHQSVAPPGLHHGNKLLVDLVQHRLCVGALLFGLRAERVEKTLVFPGREQATLHAQLFHACG